MKTVNLSIIKDLAKRQKMTLKQLCQQLDMTETAMQYIIKRNSTSLETLGKIADALGVSVGVFYGEKDIKPLQACINNVFQRDFSQVIDFWEWCKQYEKMLIQITGLDNQTVIQRTIDEVRSELTAKKQNEFDKTLDNIVNQSNTYINNILYDIKEKPSMMFVEKMSPSDIEYLCDFGFISEEIKAFVLQMVFKITINWNREPFINSFRRYVLQHLMDYRELAVQMIINSTIVKKDN